MMQDVKADGEAGPNALGTMNEPRGLVCERQDMVGEKI